MTSVLLDVDKMEMLKVIEGEDEVLRCEYWADILIPKNEFYICGDTNRDLTKFTLMELQMLYNNTSGAQVKFRDYPHALEMVSCMRERFDRAPEDVGQLVKKLGKHLGEQSFKPVKEKPEPKAKQTGEVPKRPKEGSMTVRVWEAGDWYYDQQESKDINSKVLRDEVIQACVLSGLNSSTAATQFGKWKKFMLAQ